MITSTTYTPIKVRLPGELPLREAVITTPYTDNYNETLDSLSIVIKHVDEKITLNPYDIVEVFRGVSSTYENGEYIDTDIKWLEMLVDNVNITRTRYGQDSFYTYTLDLMSETKWLEKIQLPNRSFTHKLGGSSRNAYEVIEDLMGYVPTVILEGKENKLITISDSVRAYFNGLEMKDLQLSHPTLRNALTAVMSQFGCIPVVKNRQLEFIDFNDETNTFKLGEMDSEAYSNSSDSYVNTLKSNLSNVLGGTVKEYAIGFRDRSTGLLQLENNLILNTTYPIYKIKKLELVSRLVLADNAINLINTAYPKGSFNQNIDTGLQYTDNSGNIVKNDAVYIYDEDNKLCVDLFFYDLNVKKNLDLSNTAIKINRFKTKVVSYWYYVGVVEGFKKGSYPTINEDTITTYKSPTYTATWGTYGTGGYAIKLHIVFDNIAYDSKYFYSFDFNNANYKVWWSNLVSKRGSTVSNTSDTYLYSKSYTVFKLIHECNITSLVKTSEERRLLDYDYLKEYPTLEEASKNYYATLQYDVGGTTIEGFSTKWTKTDWAGFTEDKVLIWNLLKQLDTELNNELTSDTNNLLNILCSSATFNYHGQAISYTNHDLPDLEIFKLLFNIEYDALIDINITNTKSGFAVPLEQLDSSSNGITDFNAFMDVEKDKIDRLGNELHIVTKRYFYADSKLLDPFTNIIPLGAKSSTGEVVYKRTITFKNDYLDVAYYLCKDYVIANYNTSITTKYRAFQYVDYSSAIERNENRKAYIVFNSNKRIYSQSFTKNDIEYNAGIGFHSDDVNVNLISVFLPFLTDEEVDLKIGARRVGVHSSIDYSSLVVQAGTTMRYDYGLVCAFKFWDTVSGGIQIDTETKNSGMPQYELMYSDTNNEIDLSTCDIGFINSFNDDWVGETIETNLLPALDDTSLIYDNYISFSLNGIIQDQSELILFTQQIEYKSYVNSVKIYKDISSIARIQNDNKIKYSYTLAFNVITPDMDGKPNDYIVVDGNKITVSNDITIFANSENIISFKKGTYYVGLSPYNIDSIILDDVIIQEE